jgi:hypothetical protein
LSNANIEAHRIENHSVVRHRKSFD